LLGHLTSAVTSRRAEPRAREREDPFSVLSIGALSRATGVPVETLRTWERRYGFPAPAARIESGHRRYPIETVDRLRLVVRAIEMDHKPSIALRATIETLMELIAVGKSSRTEARESRLPESASFLDRCLDHVVHLDGSGFVDELHRAWGEQGPLEFLTGSMAPLLDAIGACWERGAIEVGQEHFASEHVREFLATRWRHLSENARGPRVVCATLPDEQHVLGLHVAATALALGGAHVIFLGGPTPPGAIASVVSRRLGDAVILSASSASDRRLLDREFATLRRSVPTNVPIIVGGSGFDPPPDGALLCSKLQDVAAITRTLVRRGG
jgi:methylmalonyl-CoA mutase cobalamin-binding subunit